jgi:hypothetical protein
MMMMMMMTAVMMMMISGITALSGPWPVVKDSQPSISILNFYPPVSNTRLSDVIYPQHQPSCFELSYASFSF